jgi:hypothetical protein
MRILLVVLLLLWPGAIAAQAPDTLTFEVIGYGLVSGVGHDCPIRNDKLDRTMYPGSEITCPIWVVDADGDPTPGTIVLEVMDSTVVQAFVTGDSLLTIRQLRKGNTHIKMFPRPILLVATVYPDNLAYYGPGAMAWDTVQPLWATVTRDPVTLQPVVHVHTMLCAYLGDGFGGAVAKGRATRQAVPCPDMGGTPLPEFPVTWSVLSDVTDANGMVPLPRPVIAMRLQQLALSKR